MDNGLSAKIEEWSQPPFDKETTAQLEVLKQNPEQLDVPSYKTHINSLLRHKRSLGA